MRRRYRRKPSAFVTAVRLELETDGFTYRKWGGEQRCKQGDWLVDNDGDVYSVDATSFDKTYRQLGPGVYLKTTPVWAEAATAEGSISTKEGRTRYEPGDYIVFNNKDGSDGYAVEGRKFQEMYEEDS
jgi:hypothetical protein